MKRQIAEIDERCCPPLLDSALGEQEAEGLASAFGVLADPARLRLLSLLASFPSGEACVCVLTEPLGLSQPTVSHHLKVLHQAGLLSREQRGVWAYYRIRAERLQPLAEALLPDSAPARSLLPADLLA